MIRLFTLCIFLFSWCISVSQCCIAIDASVITQSLLNTYYPVSGEFTATTGSTAIPLGAVPPDDPFGNSYGVTPVSPGDLLLVIQIQGADLSAANSPLYGSGSASSGPDGLGGTGYSALNGTGVYEFVIASNHVPLSGGLLLLEGECAGGGLLHTYVNQEATAVSGQRRFQVVRVPRFHSLHLTEHIVSAAWNGSAGGVLALHVADTLFFDNYSIDASGSGSRGGYQNVQPSGNNIADYVTTSEGISSGKGEGIAGTPRFLWDGQNQVDLGAGWAGYPGGNYGRGAPGNAGGGGNDHNAGGGGGGNGGAGGVGGNGVIGFGSAVLPNGGRPGSAMPSSAGNLFLGGGGGGGDANNALTGIKGGAGGGIVIISAGTLAGQGIVRSNGTAGQPGVFSAAPDGAGGGGAGGTVVLKADQVTADCALTVEARGGQGGHTINDSTDPHGPGGGGGGGVILHQVPGDVLVMNAGPGLRGLTNSGAGTNWGSADGQAGIIASFPGELLPVIPDAAVYPLPVAEFAPVSGCAGEEMTFADQSYVAEGWSAAIVSRTWSFGDGTGASGGMVAHTYSAAGTYSVQLVVHTNHDCSDTLIRAITVYALPAVEAGQPATICEGDWLVPEASGATDYGWSDGLFNGVGFQPEEGEYAFTVTGTDENGCSNSDVLAVSVLPAYSVPLDVSVCEGETATVGNSVFSAAGEYAVELQSASGCDSLIMLNLQVFPVYAVPLSIDLCYGESYSVAGSVFSQPGEYPVMLQSAAGCDSLVQLSLSIHPAFSEMIEASVCPGDTFTYAGNAYSAPGEYILAFQTVQGCDSLLTIGLDWHPEYDLLFPVQVCPGESVEFEGQVFSVPGIYEIPLQTIYGCDSLRTLELIYEPVYTTEVSASVCAGGSLELGSETFTEAGVYEVLLQSAAGCDSTVVLSLELLQHAAGSAEAVICKGETYEFGTMQLSEPGEYEAILVSTSGCDSLVTLRLDVVDPAFPDFYFPNIFTPNGDGLNDTFRLGGDRTGLVEMKITVFNRWGEEVFQSALPEFEWNGGTPSGSASEGVYYFTATWRMPCSQEEQRRMGYVSLSR
jgi:gliding motility-associated-like protein